MGHVIKQQAGTKYYKIVEEIRLNSKNYRATKNEKYLNEIFNLLKNLKPEEIYVITKSFTIFFYLSHFAEQVFREHFLKIKKINIKPSNKKNLNHKLFFEFIYKNTNPKLRLKRKFKKSKLLIE